MMTTDYTKPYRDEFRITKTDVKKALQAAISTNVYSLTQEFQQTLNHVYESIKFRYITRCTEQGNLEHALIVYEICGVEVTFHKDFKVRCFASNYENTTSDDFIFTLMNTLIPLLTELGMMKRVLDIDAFED